MGSYVLLTLLPAVFRYRALCKEREKLIRILDWTGAYQSEEVKRRNRQREQEQERQRVVLEQQAREKQRQAPPNEKMKSQNLYSLYGTSHPVLRSTSFCR